MSTHIHKDIGFFIPNQKISDIFKYSHEEMFEQLDEFEFSDEFFEELLTDIQNYPLKKDFKFVEEIIIKDLIESSNFDFSQFFKSIYHFDSFEGILLSDPEINKKCRFDDDIDFLENPEYEFKIQYLKHHNLITYQYICTKKFKSNYKTFKVDEIISSHAIARISPDCGLLPNYEYFTPLNLIPYLFCKKMNFLVDNLSLKDFYSFFNPVIVTSMG